jgi:hypothetical protein
MKIDPDQDHSNWRGGIIDVTDLSLDSDTTLLANLVLASLLYIFRFKHGLFKCDSVALLRWAIFIWHTTNWAC